MSAACPPVLDSVKTQPNPKVLGKCIGSFDDSGFNQHLSRRNVDFFNNTPDVLKTGRRIGNEKFIGSTIDRHPPRLREVSGFCPSGR